VVLLQVLLAGFDSILVDIHHNDLLDRVKTKHLPRCSSFSTPALKTINVTNLCEKVHLKAYGCEQGITSIGDQQKQ
jgi:hypothetical protein